MKRILGNGRYANVTATLALIVALGGTSYAAISLPRNSVGGKQLKNRAVTNSKLRASAVTSAKVKNGSLRARDFKTSDLPVGPAGPAGATNLITRQFGSQYVNPGDSGSLTVTCNPGEHMVTAGLRGDEDRFTPSIFTVTESSPVTQTGVTGPPVGWYLEVKNVSSSPNQFPAYVVCAQP